MENKIQGVTSCIEFPIGQDEIAITKAIQDLLRDGWKFEELRKDSILLMRSWEYQSKGGLIEAVKQLKKTKAND